MKYSMLVVSVLPYLINISVKLVTHFFDPKLMRKTLRSLVAMTARANGETFDLDGNRQEVIIAHLSHESLKAAVILTTLASFFAAVLVLWNSSEKRWPLPLLFVLFVLSVILVGWTYTKDIAYMSDINRLRLRRDTSVVLVLCFYDAILGILTVVAEVGRPPSSLTSSTP